MPCPTCDHTLHHVADFVFWCPRCGTVMVKLAGNTRPDTYVPKLVERCREFQRQAIGLVISPIGVADVWRRTGVAVSINPPGGRPT